MFNELIGHIIPNLACAAAGIAAGHAYATWAQRRRRKVVSADPTRSIGGMCLGETGWVVPWAVFEHARGFYAKGSFAVSPSRRGLVCLQIERIPGGVAIVNNQWVRVLSPKMSYGPLWPTDQRVLNLKAKEEGEKEKVAGAAG